MQIRAFQQGDSIVVHVEDDGRGIQLEEIKKAALKRNFFASSQLEQMTEHQLLDIIFQPGFSTTSATPASIADFGMPNITDVFSS